MIIGTESPNTSSPRAFIILWFVAFPTIRFIGLGHVGFIHINIHTRLWIWISSLFSLNLESIQISNSCSVLWVYRVVKVNCEIIGSAFRNSKFIGFISLSILIRIKVL